MGDFVAFRNKGRGRVAAYGDYSSRVEPRVKFIKGWEPGVETDPEDGSVECGPLESYNTEVTMEQLCDIMYRVRDSKFTAGGYTSRQERVFGSGSTLWEDTEVALTDVEPPLKMIESELTADVYASSRRGYGRPGSLTGFDEMFDAEYTYKNENDLTVKARDAKGELAMWFNDPLVTNNLSVGSYLTFFPYFVTGFSHNLYSKNKDFSATPPTIYTLRGTRTRKSGSPLTYGMPVRLDLDINDTVAWVGGTGPYDPESRLFLELSFAASVQVAFEARMQTYNKYISSLNTEVKSNLIIRFGSTPSASDITVPLYSNDSTSTDGTYTFVVTADEDFVIEAKKWWPYADQAGNPVYNETTGLPL